MKAQKIFENIDFRRTHNSKKSLGVGDAKPVEIGDKFEMLVDLYWHPGEDGRSIGQWGLGKLERLSDGNPIFKGDVFTVTEFAEFSSAEPDEQWVEVFKENSNRNHMEVNWIKKYLNKYLRRI